MANLRPSGLDLPWRTMALYGRRLRTRLDLEIKAWGIAGGSPYEFEQFQKQVPEARTTFIVVSTYDLDEAMICDFRANIVPISQTIKTLWANPRGLESIRNIALSQYPMTWLRTLFPTLGRSRGIMGKLRKVWQAGSSLRPRSETLAGPVMKLGKGAGDDEYTLAKNKRLVQIQNDRPTRCHARWTSKDDHCVQRPQATGVRANVAVWLPKGPDNGHCAAGVSRLLKGVHIAAIDPRI